MPPFHAAGPIGRYQFDPRLTEEEIETVARWVDRGAPRGNPAHLPPANVWPSDEWILGEPDLILRPKQAFTISRSPEEMGKVKETLVLIDLNHEFDEDVYIEALEFRPDNLRIVHHAVLNTLKAGAILPAQGDYNVLQWEGKIDKSIASLVPGSPPATAPNGFPYEIGKGTRIALQAHYVIPAESEKNEESDSTSIGIHYADTVIYRTLRRLHMELDLSAYEIQPHQENLTLTTRKILQHDVNVFRFFCHMHFRGRSFQVDRIMPDGAKKQLFKIPRYDFHWQRLYDLKQPLFLPKGSEIEFTSVWDNSSANHDNPDPTKKVRFGLRSSDEMMYSGFEYEIPNDFRDPPIILRDGKIAKGRQGRTLGVR